MWRFVGLVLLVGPCAAGPTSREDIAQEVCATRCQASSQSDCMSHCRALLSDHIKHVEQVETSLKQGLLLPPTASVTMFASVTPHASIPSPATLGVKAAPAFPPAHSFPSITFGKALPKSEAPKSAMLQVSSAEIKHSSASAPSPSKAQKPDMNKLLGQQVCQPRCGAKPMKEQEECMSQCIQLLSEHFTHLAQAEDRLKKQFQDGEPPPWEPRKPVDQLVPPAPVEAPVPVLAASAPVVLSSSPVVTTAPVAAASPALATATAVAASPTLVIAPTVAPVAAVAVAPAIAAAPLTAAAVVATSAAVVTAAAVPAAALAPAPLVAAPAVVAPAVAPLAPPMTAVAAVPPAAASVAAAPVALVSTDETQDDDKEYVNKICEHRCKAKAPAERAECTSQCLNLLEEHITQVEQVLNPETKSNTAISLAETVQVTAKESSTAASPSTAVTPVSTAPQASQSLPISPVFAEVPAAVQPAPASVAVKSALIQSKSSAARAVEVSASSQKDVAVEVCQNHCLHKVGAERMACAAHCLKLLEDRDQTRESLEKAHKQDPHDTAEHDRRLAQQVCTDHCTSKEDPEACMAHCVSVLGQPEKAPSPAELAAGLSTVSLSATSKGSDAELAQQVCNNHCLRKPSALREECMAHCHKLLVQSSLQVHRNDPPPREAVMVEDSADIDATESSTDSVLAHKICSKRCASDASPRSCLSHCLALVAVQLQKEGPARKPQRPMAHQALAPHAARSEDSSGNRLAQEVCDNHCLHKGPGEQEACMSHCLLVLNKHEAEQQPAALVAVKASISAPLAAHEQESEKAPSKSAAEHRRHVAEQVCQTHCLQQDAECMSHCLQVLAGGDSEGSGADSEKIQDVPPSSSRLRGRLRSQKLARAD